MILFLATWLDGFDYSVFAFLQGGAPEFGLATLLAISCYFLSSGRGR